MGGRGFKPALFVALCLLMGFGSGTVQAGSAEAIASARQALESGAGQGVKLTAHFRKQQSFYCYPKTIGGFIAIHDAGQATRGAPGFHYLETPAISGGGSRPAMK
jgi:hypothetical protein